MRNHVLFLLLVVLSGCSLIVPSSSDFTIGDAGSTLPSDAGTDAAMAAPDAACPMTCGGICTDTMSDPMHCGSCTRSCSAPANGAAVCDDGNCDFECELGYARTLGMCVEREAPRPITPLSTSTVTSRRPTLRWELAARADGARVEFCEDRACSTVIMTIDAPGSSVRPPSDLPTGVVFWRMFSLEGGVPGTVASPTWLMHVGVRSADGDVDTSWGTVLDVNADGFADVAISAPSGDVNPGRVYVYLGGPGGLSAIPTRTLVGPDGPDGGFGNQVASAGDLNGDGYADLLVTAGGSGRTYVYLGGRQTTELFVAPPIILVGHGVGVGDVDQDGYADVMAIGGDADTSQALIYLGSQDGMRMAVWDTLEYPVDERVVVNVGGAGDLDADGSADLAVGTISLTGEGFEVRIYLGGATGGFGGAVRTMTGGTGVAVGDTDGDGRPDHILASSTGAHYFRRWPGGFDTPIPLSAPRSIGRFAVAGDVDRDGYDDLLAAATVRSSSTTGNAYVFHGGPSGLESDPTSTLNDPSDPHFGANVAGVGDVDANGYPDLVVSADDFFGGTDPDGRAWLYLVGPTGIPATPSLTLFPDISGARFGFSITGD